MAKEKESAIEEIKEKITDKIAKKKEAKKIKPLVTSRILFISVLDKILLVSLILGFVLATISNFAGPITSASYGYWGRVFGEIGLMIGFAISYFFTNWLYKCYAKTVLCLTEKEVYKEHYVPFKRTETTIPLNKITSVSTVNVFWIFRSLIICQYGRLPLVFFTWNNQEFKDKLNELITTDKEPVENEFKDKNLIDKSMLKYFAYAGIALAAIILFIGVIKFFSFLFGTERRIAGTYANNNREIVLNKDGTCDINSLANNVTECKWSYSNNEVVIDYKYQSYSYWSTSYSNEYSNSYTFNYSKNILSYNGTEYIKK